MLKKLRRKLVAIITIFAGSILVLMISMSYYTFYRTQRGIVNEALSMSMHGGVRDVSTVAGSSGESGSYPAKMLAVCVDIDSEGVILRSNSSSIEMDSSAFEEILYSALTSDASSGYSDSLDVAWQKAKLSDGAWRVAVVDTSSITYSLKSQFVQDLLIILGGLLALILVSWGVSGWVLKPVSNAWEQQRRFVADASHELKTPLSVIIANTEILLKDKDLPESSKRWVRSTSDESNHMKGLVEELLELARADEDQIVEGGIAHIEDVDLSEITESATLEFDAIAFESGTQVDEHIEDGIHVTGDSEWISRLVRILLDNACKYAQAGTTITVRLARQGRRCVLSVNNFGEVIAPDDLEHVFDRFYRTDEARSRDSKAGGFGLGLAIAKSIATSTGGDIAAESTAESGTTFTVTLPLKS